VDSNGKSVPGTSTVLLTSCLPVTNTSTDKGGGLLPAVGEEGVVFLSLLPQANVMKAANNGTKMVGSINFILLFNPVGK
jgi:hypothetical protein